MQIASIIMYNFITNIKSRKKLSIKNNVMRAVKKFISDSHYWVMSHTIRRYHILDLRQPKNNISNEDNYDWGWQDIDRRMLFAIFNLLNEFVKYEMPYRYIPSEEDVADDPSLKEQRDSCLEVLAIHKWWNEDRKRDAVIIEKALEVWWKIGGGIKNINNHSIEADSAHREWMRLNDDFNKKEDNMIMRLMMVRRSLWT
jgi:hypothetical protein